MSLMDIAASVETEIQDTTMPRCVVGQALRLIEKHDPQDLTTAVEWVAGAKSQSETAAILTRYVATKDSNIKKIAPGSVGNHHRKGCACESR